MTAGAVADIPRDGEWLATISLLARTGARIGDTRRAGELCALLEPHAEQAVIAGRGAICLGPVSRFAGLAAATAGRRDAAVAHLEHALAMARRWGAEPIVAGIELELADVLERFAAMTGGERHVARVRELRSAGLATARRLELGGLLGRWATEEDAGVGVGVAAADNGVAAADGNGGSAGAGALAADAPLAFYRRGDIWTIGRAGRQIQLRDAKGLGHIARLIAAPQVEFHALDLVVGVSSADRGQSAAATAAALTVGAGIEVRARGEGDAGPALDSQAKAAYRSRVAELQEEIEEAESFHDPERAARAREELEFVARELAGAVGLGGRDRKTGSDAERARVNVTRAIRTALKRVSEHDAVLGHQLGAAIRTGTFCVYEPAPGDAPVWDLRGPA